MIIIRLMGGLGNQLFQYAFARAFGFTPYDGAYIKMNKISFEIVPNLVRELLGISLNENELDRLLRIGKQCCRGLHI